VPIKPQIKKSALAAEGHGVDWKEIQKPTSAAEAAILGDASGTTEVMPFPFSLVILSEAKDPLSTLSS
jgi:hypothetical protein